VEVQELDTSIEVCIARDALREKPVGKKLFQKTVQNTALPKAIICDLDGTLALMNGRNAFDASTCDQDLRIEPVANVLNNYKILGYKGIIQKENSNEVLLSSISKGEVCIGYLSVNQVGYSKYCKEYTEYWEWIDKRNNERYETKQQHGKNYDSKNRMHTIRLLQSTEQFLFRIFPPVLHPNSRIAKPCIF
jgi:hypothetical protein